MTGKIASIVTPSLIARVLARCSVALGAGIALGYLAAKAWVEAAS